MLPMAVARSSSGRVTKSEGEGAVLGVFFPMTMHCTAWHLGPIKTAETDQDAVWGDECAWKFPNDMWT